MDVYGVQPSANARKGGFAIHIAMHDSVVYDALAVPSVLSHVIESTRGPANSHGSGLKVGVNQYR
jgi:hypothetical protein